MSTNCAAPGALKSLQFVAVSQVPLNEENHVTVAVACGPGVAFMFTVPDAVVGPFAPLTGTLIGNDVPLFC